MTDADATWLKVRDHYHQVLETAAAGGWGEGAVIALWQVGRDYAHALTQHTNATMAWLMFVDKQFRTSKEKGAGR